MLTAVTLDFWDTIYLASSTPARVQRRHEVMQSMLRALGRDLPADEFKALYHASYEEAERWWREHRGYTTADRIRWLLGQLAIERPEDCEHVTRAVEEIDDKPEGCVVQGEAGAEPLETGDLRDLVGGEPQCAYDIP